MRIVCISDTHGDHLQVELPDGDVLVHAGDITAHGEEADLLRFLDWFASRPFARHIFIAGNHDRFLEQQPARTHALSADAGVTYLDDSGCTVEGLKFWGSPITPRFYDWSFMRDPGEDIEKLWDMIPLDTQVLITHGPPWGVLDKIQRSAVFHEHTGCHSLVNRIREVRPAYHMFGHIHEEYGQLVSDGVHYLNISTMNKEYRISNAPVVIDIDPGLVGHGPTNSGPANGDTK